MFKKWLDSLDEIDRDLMIILALGTIFTIATMAAAL